MTKDEFAILLDGMQQDERDTREAGQQEYARDADNCFANFDRVAAWLGLDRETVILVYMLKHLDGIIAYVKDEATAQREGIAGRFTDFRLYAALLRAALEDRHLRVSEVSDDRDVGQRYPYVDAEGQTWYPLYPTSQLLRTSSQRPTRIVTATRFSARGVVGATTWEIPAGVETRPVVADMEADGARWWRVGNSDPGPPPV